MEYHFQDSEDYLVLRDAFSDYMYHTSNPFYWYLEDKMDVNEEQASRYIGKAHYAQFLSKLGSLELTPLAKEEIGAADTVIYELNTVIIREDVDTNHCRYSCKTQREVEKHKSLFPCVFHYGKECSISLPDEFEPLLDRILLFRDSILRFDIKELVEFLCAHYQGLDPSWAEERLTFLSRYYKPRNYMAKCQDILLRYRRIKQ